MYIVMIGHVGTGEGPQEDSSQVPPHVLLSQNARSQASSFFISLKLSAYIMMVLYLYPNLMYT
jgi:hypothetical protein